MTSFFKISWLYYQWFPFPELKVSKNSYFQMTYMTADPDNSVV